MLLHIKLRDGFFNDTVSVKANGIDVYNKTGVSTDLTISFAGATDVTVTEAIVMLEVAVKGRQNQAKEIHVKKTPYVEVWLVEGKIAFREFADEVPMM